MVASSELYKSRLGVSERFSREVQELGGFSEGGPDDIGS